MRVPSRFRSMRIRDLVAREVTPIAMPMKRAAGVEYPSASISPTPAPNGTTKPPRAASIPARDAENRVRGWISIPM
jgi:hypothetical protein